jgi:hypothetical protein
MSWVILKMTTQMMRRARSRAVPAWQAGETSLAAIAILLLVMCYLKGDPHNYLSEGFLIEQNLGVMSTMDASSRARIGVAALRKLFVRVEGSCGVTRRWS